MRTIKDTEKVTVKVTEDELIDGKWLNYELLSSKLGAIEKEKSIGYKSLRNKLYNSYACGKYNIQKIAGLRCIDIDNPMTGKASLELVFKRG